MRKQNILGLFSNFNIWRFEYFREGADIHLFMSGTSDLKVGVFKLTLSHEKRMLTLFE